VPDAGASAAEDSAPRSNYRGIVRLLLIVAVVAGVVILVFPIIFTPRIDVPKGLQYASASSLELRISNQNLTPLTDVGYICEVSKLTLADGSAVENAKVVVRANIRRLRGRQATAGRCEASAIVSGPVKTAEYKLTMTYRSFPWPQLRTSVYRIDAQVNAKGEVTGWKLD